MTPDKVHLVASAMGLSDGLEEIRQLALDLGLAAMVKNPLEDQQRPMSPSVPAPAPVEIGPTALGVAV